MFLVETGYFLTYSTLPPPYKASQYVVIRIHIRITLRSAVHAVSCTNDVKLPTNSGTPLFGNHCVSHNVSEWDIRSWCQQPDFADGDIIKSP